MAKKSNKKAVPARKAPPAKKKGVGSATWIAAAVAVVALVAVVFIVGSGGSKGTVAAAGPVSAGASAPQAAAPGAIPAEEAKYIGRLLPATYVEPAVAGAQTYSTGVVMTDVTAKQDVKQTTLAVADVVAGKIVYFEYQKPGAEPISMMAYVKPSGKLFVGVSYCIPCKGKRHDISPDGTLRCQACGTKRDLETGVGVSGGCRLYPLDEIPAAVAGGRIVIDNSVLNGWTAQPLDRQSGAF